MNAPPSQADESVTSAEARITVELGPRAAALLEQWCREHGHPPSDVVNAAVACTLCGFTAARRTLGECLEDARAERLRTPITSQQPEEASDR